MAIVKDIIGNDPDRRLLEDEARHNKKVREAVKKKITDIISEEEILTGNAKKIVKVKIPSVKERRFTFKNKNGGQMADGEGDGDEEAGGESRPSAGAGNTPGVEMLEETEIRLEEIIDLMLEDLELKDFFKAVEVKPKNKFQPVGKRKIGPYARLSKKETAKRQIARTKALAKKIGVDSADEEKRKYEESDKRYRYIRPVPDEDSRAVLFCVSDTSGSMDKERIYLARAFYFIMALSLEKKGYKNLETIFICHDATASEVSEKDFFKRTGSGGTYLSSGQEKVLEIMEQRYKGQDVSFYVFHATDGENYESDNKKLVQILEKVCSKANLVGIAKIRPSGSFSFNSKGNDFKRLYVEFPHFTIFDVKNKRDVGPALKKFLGADKGGKR